MYSLLDEVRQLRILFEESKTQTEVILKQSKMLRHQVLEICGRVGCQQRLRQSSIAGTAERDCPAEPNLKTNA